ncbi:MAG: DUF401 family protein [Bacillota bacterium]
MISFLIVLFIMGVIVYLNKKGFPLAVNLGVGTLVLATMSLKLTSIPQIIIRTITDVGTLELVASVSLIQILGYILEQTKKLQKLIRALHELISSLKIQLMMIPSIIGLIPGPGIVMLSAPLIEKAAGESVMAGLKSYVNYWFRAAIQFSCPISFSFIITISLVKVNPLYLFLAQLPVTIIMYVSGYLRELRFVRRKGSNSEIISGDKASVLKNILALLWKSDFLLVIFILTLLFDIKLYITVIVTIFMVVLQEKIRLKPLILMIKKGFSPKMLFLILSMMLFKTAIEETATMESISSWWNTTSWPPEMLFFVMPLLIGLITGAYAGAAAISFSLFAPMIIANNLNIFFVAVVYSFGKIGVMLSPVNASVLLTADYFNANPNNVFKRIARSLPSAFAMILAIYFVGSFYLD